MAYHITITEPECEPFTTAFFEIQNVMNLIRGAIDHCPEVDIKVIKTHDNKGYISKPIRKNI